MRYLSFLLSCTLTMADVSVQGHVDIQTQAYINRPANKHADNYTASTQIEAIYTGESLEGIAKISVQQDFYDLKEKSEHNHRSFIRLDELYLKYDFDDAQISLGKSIRFWGALEANNIVDSFNPKDLRTDLFDADKLGVWNFSYAYYTDNGELSLIIKVNEQDQKMPAQPFVYYFFPSFVTYDENLQTEKSKNRPSVYLKYSASTDTFYPLDYAIIFENGYDSQRYYTSSGPINGTPVNFQAHAYLVNKLMSYNTLVIDATLLKLEASYTEVLDNKLISDYYHLGLGLEHTLSQFYQQADLGLIAEYYRYSTLESGKYSDLDLFETFQNDLFLGMRYSFNEGDDASIVGGVILDMDYDEQSYYMQYQTRISDLNLNVDYRYIEPSQDDLTAFHLLQRHQRISVKLGYYF